MLRGSVQDRAAYSASQPLFDALKNGAARLEEQLAHLNIAKEEVQRMHVKLRNERSEGQASQQERYVDCTVKAWRSVTGAFATIFDGMAAMTAADASEGRAEKPDHPLFDRLARSAQEARTAAHSFDIKSDLSAGQESRVTGSKRAADSPEDERAPSRRPLKMQRTSRSGTTIALEDAAVQAATEDGGYMAEQNTGGASPKNVEEGQATFEDVSLEVEARLQEKEEKRKEKKGDKKRKRESTGSVVSLQKKRSSDKLAGGHGQLLQDKPPNQQPPKKRKKAKAAVSLAADQNAQTSNGHENSKRKAVNGQRQADESRKKKLKTAAG